MIRTIRRLVVALRGGDYVSEAYLERLATLRDVDEGRRIYPRRARGRSAEPNRVYAQTWERALR